MSMGRIGALAVLCALAGTAWGAEPLGRFFFTPAERAELDAARHRKAPAPPPPPPLAVPAPSTYAAPPVEAAPREPQVLTYRGLVKRSDGKAIVWLNNRPMDANEALAELSVRGHVQPDGAMSLVDPQTGRRIDLKVGQSVELDTAGGAAARRAPRTAPPQPARPGGAAAETAPPAQSHESERR